MSISALGQARAGIRGIEKMERATALHTYPLIMTPQVVKRHVCAQPTCEPSFLTHQCQMEPVASSQLCFQGRLLKKASPIPQNLQK